MKALLLLTFAFFAVISSRPPPSQGGKPAPEWWTKGKTILLRSGTFDTVVGKDKYAFIQFCATFVPDCERVAPQFEKVTEKYMTAGSDRDDVFIAKIDGWTFSSVSQEYDVKLFPEFLFFHKNTTKDFEKYEGEKTAEKMIEWLEAKVNSLEKTEEKAKPKEAEKQEEKKDEKKEEKKEEKAPEPAKPVVTQQQTQEPAKTNTNTQQQQQTPQDVNVVLNTSLLQSQFDDIQRRLHTLEMNLGFKVSDAIVKIDEFVKNQMTAPTESLKVLSEAHQEQARRIENIDKDLVMMKKEIIQGVTSHTERQLTDVKSTTSSIKTKVFEKRAEPPQESNFLMYMLMIIIGIAIGGAGGFFFAGGAGKPKARSYLD